MPSPTQPDLNWEFRGFANNPEGTCLGQSINWLSNRKNGVNQHNLGLGGLTANYSYSRNLQRLPNLWPSLIDDPAAQRYRYGESTEQFLSRVEWGVYNIIHITPFVSQGHAIALYYPYTSHIQLFDPNQGVYKAWSKTEMLRTLSRFAASTMSGNWEFDAVIDIGTYLT